MYVNKNINLQLTLEFNLLNITKLNLSYIFHYINLLFIEYWLELVRNLANRYGMLAIFHTYLLYLCIYLIYILTVYQDAVRIIADISTLKKIFISRISIHELLALLVRFLIYRRKRILKFFYV